MDALLIIDMQKASFEASPRWDAEGVVERINRLSQFIREREGLVIYIQHNGTEEDGHENGSLGWEILDELKRDPADCVIEKTICDSFYGTDLDAVLKRNGVNRLLISGCATDFCVDTTLRSAVSREYEVVAIADCHTTADRPHLSAEQVRVHHHYVWSDLITVNKSVRIISAEAFISEME